ncbi:MAG: DUF362 domain-containing protein [Candidatus Latescibacterota bacterium]
MDAVSGATQPGQSVVGSVASDYALLDQPWPRTADLEAEAVFTLVRWANNLSYGVANVAPPGTQQVLLVPTLRPEAATDARVLEAVVRLCAEVWPGPSVLIGIPGQGPIPAAYVALMGAVSGEADVDLVALGDEPLRPLPAMPGLTGQTCQVPEPVALADAVVVVPALWRDAAGTFHGALDAVAALSPVPLSSDSARVDWLSAVDPLYVFADALRPHVAGEVMALNTVLASDDPCALDLAAAQLLGAGPTAVPALLLSARHELGQAAWRDVAVNGVPIPKLGKRAGSGR